MKAFGIFEGGGAKGLAHVGALRACEDYGIDFCGVAGASAGAIVAALVAARYTSSDLFDPGEPEKAGALFSGDFRKLIKGHIDWPGFESLAGDIKKLAQATWVKTNLAWYWWKHSQARKLLAKHKGLFDPESFAVQLDAMLERKLLSSNPIRIANRKFGTMRSEGERYRVMFSDLPIPLKIIATDLSGGRVVVFSEASTPDVPVAKAVAASIAIPLFFIPVTIHSDVLNTSLVAVDGGVLSNFPAWLFDTERGQMGPQIPTLGFRLVVKETPPDQLVEGKLFPFLRRLLGVAVTGDPILETRQIDNLREVPLRISASTLDFDMTPPKKVELFGEGYASAFQVFGTPGFPVEPVRVEKMLAAIVQAIKKGSGRADSLVRACVLCPTTKDTLRVTYSYAMDTSEDTDDLLEMGKGVGASGTCWTSGQLVRVDMTQASTDYDEVWRMTKYQQALVRRDLKALICMPISSSKGEILGVLSLDSPDGAMLQHFQTNSTEAVLWTGSQNIAEILELGAVGDKEIS